MLRRLFPQGNTSQLRSHLGMKHPAVFARLGGCTPAGGGRPMQLQASGNILAFARGAMDRHDFDQLALATDCCQISGALTEQLI